MISQRTTICSFCSKFRYRLLQYAETSVCTVINYSSYLWIRLRSAVLVVCCVNNMIHKLLPYLHMQKVSGLCPRMTVGAYDCACWALNHVTIIGQLV